MPIFKHNIGLSLSGGGYRASAFHLGTLKKLEDMEILSKVDVLSTISGGSITGAAWCLHEGDYLSFHIELKNKLHTKGVIGNILRSAPIFIPMLFTFLLLLGSFVLTFTCWAPLSFLILGLMIYAFKNLQFKIFPMSKMIERAYNKFFFFGKTLSDLKEKPIIAIGSSNLETGRPFTFSKTRMSDSYYAFPPDNVTPIHFLPAQFPVARAVMASSAVPGPFT